MSTLKHRYINDFRKKKIVPSPEIQLYTSLYHTVNGGEGIYYRFTLWFKRFEKYCNSRNIFLCLPPLKFCQKRVQKKYTHYVWVKPLQFFSNYFQKLKDILFLKSEKKMVSFKIHEFWPLEFQKVYGSSIKLRRISSARHDNVS